MGHILCSNCLLEHIIEDDDDCDSAYARVGQP